MKNIVIGIAAHVDAGKTTLSENMLYATGAIRSLGRVDHGDTFLDTDDIERSRGITVFSKEASLTYKDMRIRLVDTPGHVDFSAETERSLYVLDYAVLLVSALDGVQSHTRRLFSLFEKYNLPVFIFVNKTDIMRREKADLLNDLKKSLSSDCIDFSLSKDELLEELATADDDIFEVYSETGNIPDDMITDAVLSRKVFPVTFGSALKNEGVTGFLDILFAYTKEREYKDSLSARVYKITRDAKGNRLTHLRITGGALNVRDSLLPKDAYPEDAMKVTEIREYSGDKYQTRQSAPAGSLVAVTGLNESYTGQGFGEEEDAPLPTLVPVLSYSVLHSPEQNPRELYSYFTILTDEDPMLSVSWNEKTETIGLSLMGEIQTAIIKDKFKERFGEDIDFGAGKIMYKETIAEPTMGHGHFEPLRHFADVILKMEPLPAGEGIVLRTECPTDVLDRHYQNQILNSLKRPIHGVLTSSTLTDVKITLLSGKSHKKHTEGGDFRKATGIAVRDALLRTDCVLLEPYYKMDMTIPVNSLGRIMTEIDAMSGKLSTPNIRGDFCTVTGTVPVKRAIGFAAAFQSFTGGEGDLRTELYGYYPCHDAEAVIEEIGYDFLTDLNNPYESIYVHRDEVPDVIGQIMKRGGIPGTDEGKETAEELAAISAEAARGTAGESAVTSIGGKPSGKGKGGSSAQSLDDELAAIFERTFGTPRRKLPVKRDNIIGKQEQIEKAREEYLQAHPALSEKKNKPAAKKKHYVLVDGYNVIHTWQELKELAADNLEAARGRLSDMMVNYAGFEGCELILVFDAYRVKGGSGSVQKYQNIYIVYTKEAQTADAYIERTTHEMLKKDTSRVTVVSSDGLIQMIVAGEGAARVSSREFEEMVRSKK